MLSDVITEMGAGAPDHEFAADLYELLAFKHLRGFKTFAQSVTVQPHPRNVRIFFAGETASYRGDFIGFAPTLSILAPVSKPGPCVFYSTRTEPNLPVITRPLFKTNIFFTGAI